MLSGDQHHFGGPLDRLGGQLQGNVTGQSAQHAPVGQRLDHLVDVGGATAGETGDGIDERFLDRQCDPDGRQQPRDQIGIRVGGCRPDRECRGGDPYQAGGVGHHTNQPCRFSQSLRECLQRDAGGDRDNQVIGANGGSQPSQDLGHLLGLDGQHDHVGPFGHLGVALHDRTPGRFGKRLGRRRHHVAADDRCGRTEPRRDQSAGQGGGHPAGSHKSHSR